VAQTVWSRDTSSGHHIEITWSGAQTATPTGALDGSTMKRTRYFFDVMVDEMFYFGNRFLTSADAEGITDTRGTPILARSDLLLKLCAERIATALEAGNLDSLPNDLGYIDLDALVASDRDDLDA
jgi:hypothetical protein